MRRLLLARSRLHGARRTPKRPPWIDPVRIDLKHLVVKLLSGSARLRQPVEIADVLPRFFDDPGTVLAVGSLMGSDNGAGVERLNLVERGNPLLPLLHIRLGKIEVHVLVGGIAG